jgi:hypothetical protein
VGIKLKQAKKKTKMNLCFCFRLIFEIRRRNFAKFFIFLFLNFIKNIIIVMICLWLFRYYFFSKITETMIKNIYIYNDKLS